jgi:hypothetical protein
MLQAAIFVAAVECGLMALQLLIPGSWIDAAVSKLVGRTCQEIERRVLDVAPQSLQPQS